ncbi:GNAT family N-acetyltransferase [Marinicella litoralis]|uniref:N-acetylglutamate synthase-like GNAT family acetyltransferase n=1 Tax=Marinicella litoralis TaxID=644220 RepID=A0A4R6XRR2_9GAMM|nr:GNAT family N-acetyltransferase [Marinicella litoralis]TDR22426.1 N-acetylglutamate synthase-like GNAT family acetyltransferase [Marinicella litoralis]
MPDDWLAYQNNSKLIQSDITFKAISDKDMAFLCELYATTRWEEVLQAPWNDQQRLDFLKQQFEAQHKHYLSHYPKAEKLIIKQNKKQIGRIYIDRDETSICLIDVAILPSHRGHGLGTQLLQELLIEAQDDNKKVVIHVENFNPAYAWYLKHGFKQVEDKGVYQYMEWYPE